MDEELREVGEEKDLGVVIDRELKFSGHLAEKIKKANRIVGLIRRTFVTLDESIFKLLYVALVRPHLEYANQVWCPSKKKDISAVEGVQRRATKLLPNLKNLPYPERLRKLGIPTLAYRRSRGDMIETFKIVNGVYDDSVCGGLFVRSDRATRGHGKKLYKQRARLNIRKDAFCNRVVNRWNSFPDSVVNSTIDYSLRYRELESQAQ
ncbi:hypothetical protein Pcinc_025986 [Petrolisthes cinctipes]|uniref:Uncharacterized protein n=1 Tax=Petrolisthes cinctipes TaxID=88211 RepID=A0AAE1KD04_PETCI|nr:hypothetical protein Pcinc_025986 [Petrolisthes cinctipes]